MGSILFRYITREIAAPFLIGVVIFTMILFIARILKLVDLVVNRGIPVLDILHVFLYVLPAFLELTVPMALLLGLLWGFGRLAADRELTALKRCGFSLYQLALPVAVSTAVVFIATFLLTLQVRPWSNTALKHAIYDMTKTRATAGLKEKTFNNDFSHLVIYAEEILPPGSLLSGVMIADTRAPEHKNTIFAQRGLIIANEEKQLLTLRLMDGTIHSTRPPAASYQTTHFSVYDITLNVATALAAADKPDRDPQDMRVGELLGSTSRADMSPEERRERLVEFHGRFSLPFACIVFSLIALPLGTQSFWLQRSVGFGVSLGVILAYYLLLTVGETLGQRGLVPPMLAVWIPNIALGALGLHLFRRAASERPFLRLGRTATRLRPAALLPSSRA